jgi:hypothetical protein
LTEPFKFFKQQKHKKRKRKTFSTQNRVKIERVTSNSKSWTQIHDGDFFPSFSTIIKIKNKGLVPQQTAQLTPLPNK